MRLRTIKIAAFLLLISLVSFKTVQQDCTPVGRVQIKTMLVQLGYVVKDIVTDPGKEKYSVTLINNGLDIPIGIEQSPSGRYIWLTANLGQADSTQGHKYYALLKRNGVIQPSQFYITSSGRLMAGHAIENKGVTNFLVRERLESLANRVGESKALWQ